MRRARERTVTTEVRSILPQTEGTWQVDWLELSYNRDGVLLEKVLMRAFFEVYQSQPRATSEEALRANRLSVYIRDFNWARREAREVRQ